jgi:hypothetical protein
LDQAASAQHDLLLLRSRSRSGGIVIASASCSD